MKKMLLLISLYFILQMGVIQAQEKIDEAALLLQLDRDFDKATDEKGVEGWVSYFAPNGSMVGDTSRPIIGPLDIRKTMEPLFEDSTFSLRWQPTKSAMLIPELLGYTIGRYVRLKIVAGKPMKWTGNYSTIWMKQPDGSWKIVFDTGNPDDPPKEVK